MLIMHSTNVCECRLCTRREHREPELPASLGSPGAGGGEGPGGEDDRHVGKGCDRREHRLQTCRQNPCFQCLGTIVLPGLDEPDCGFLHTFAVYSSRPLHTQFPLPGMFSLCLPG